MFQKTLTNECTGKFLIVSFMTHMSPRTSFHMMEISAKFALSFLLDMKTAFCVYQPMEQISCVFRKMFQPQRQISKKCSHVIPMTTEFQADNVQRHNMQIQIFPDLHYKRLHKKIKPRVLTLGALALQCPDPFQHCVQLLQLFSSDQLKMKHYCFSFCSPMLYLLCYLQSTSCRMAHINSELLCCHNECWIHTPSRLQMSRRRTQVSLGSFLYYFSFEK